MTRFAGHVAVVTGAGSGIGRAVADRWVAEGGGLVAADLGGHQHPGGERVTVITGSVGDPGTADRMVAAALDRWGRLDAAFLNAGIAAMEPITIPSLETFERLLDVDLRGVVHGLRACVRPMLTAGRGAVVATASIAGLGGDASTWAYSAAKGAVVNLVRSVAVELSTSGVRVNAVCPGQTITGSGFRERNPKLARAFEERIPMRRSARADEVAAVALFLASEDASYVTGVAVPVDGGLLASTGLFDLPPERNLA